MSNRKDGAPRHDDLPSPLQPLCDGDQRAGRRARMRRAACRRPWWRHPFAWGWRQLRIAALRAEIGLDESYYRYLERDQIYGDKDLCVFRKRIQAARCLLIALENQ
jgi:hypothetical protein